MKDYLSAKNYNEDLEKFKQDHLVDFFKEKFKLSAEITGDKFF